MPNQGKVQSVVFDNLFTPEYAVKPLVPYFEHLRVKFNKKNRFFTIWEPCGIPGGSAIIKVFDMAGYSYQMTIYPKFNFLRDKPWFEFDAIITNPPYSSKNQILQKCYEYGKPFALLLPLSTLETPPRSEMFSKYGLQLLVFDERVGYTQEKNWQNTSWFCWKVLPKDLMFEKLIKDDEVLKRNFIDPRKNYNSSW